jgi:2-(1,2-epoxy-1,2-dihydrophenyl)acetyl-CoA isomerase
MGGQGQPGNGFHTRLRVPDRPERNNSMDERTARALHAGALDLLSDDEVRCLVLTGAGKTFNTGADLTVLAGDASDEPQIRRIADELHGFVAALLRAPKPVVCGVNGVAAGGGIGPALAGDIVLASESARFEFAYPRIGFSADGGSTWLLPRLVGLRTAQEIAFRDQPVPANEAADLGLVTEAIPDDEFEAALAAEAERLANGPTRAYATTRMLLRESLERGPEAQMAEEGDRIARLTRTGDFERGIEAFVNKETPEFRGE